MQIIRYVSTFTPIRTACGDLGISGLMQTMEEDLVRWAVEAQDLIGSESALQLKSGKFPIKNNKIRYCADMKFIDCLQVNGHTYSFQQRNNCEDLVTGNCPCVARDVISDRLFTSDGCFINFNEDIADGTMASIKYLARPTDDNGYPMVADVCVIAIQEYIKWKICVRTRDNRTAESQRRWYELCKQARAKYNKLTQPQIEALGFIYRKQNIGR